MVAPCIGVISSCYETDPRLHTTLYWYLCGQVRCGGKRWRSTSPRPPCDETASVSVGPSPRQTPGPPCPYPSDSPPPDATTKHAVGPSTCSTPSDHDKTKTDGRDPPQAIHVWTCRDKKRHRLDIRLKKLSIALKCTLLPIYHSLRGKTVGSCAQNSPFIHFLSFLWVHILSIQRFLSHYAL